MNEITITNETSKSVKPNPKYYYPNLVGKMRLCNGTPEGVEALRKSLERNKK